MKTAEQWIEDYHAGNCDRPRSKEDFYKMGIVWWRGDTPREIFEEVLAEERIGKRERLDRWKNSQPRVSHFPKPPAGERKSVTPDEPRHVKPLLPEMRTANICECCGKAFETARRHAATCGANCRKRKSRGQCK